MMYNEKLKDYTRSVAREMIHLDLERWADDCCDSGGTKGWLDFLGELGLTFCLIGEGRASYWTPLAGVLEDQFGRLKLDLALAHALALKLGFDSPSPEAPEITLRLGRLLRGIVVRDLRPSYWMSAAEQRNLLFKIYQTRRRIRYTFRGIDPTSYSHHRAVVMRDMLEKCEWYVRYHDLSWKISDDATEDTIHDFIGDLEKRGDAGPDDELRWALYSRHVIDFYHDH